jgi:hypothetical protein
MAAVSHPRSAGVRQDLSYRSQYEGERSVRNLLREMTPTKLCTLAFGPAILAIAVTGPAVADLPIPVAITGLAVALPIPPPQPTTDPVLWGP